MVKPKERSPSYELMKRFSHEALGHSLEDSCKAALGFAAMCHARLPITEEEFVDMCRLAWKHFGRKLQ
jgi:hypothetical protein